MIPGDRLLCVFPDSRHVGDVFTSWPLHITIVPWFRVDVPSDDLGRALTQCLDALEPFRVTVEGETQMGHRGRKTVNLVGSPSPLEMIHTEARALLHEHKAWLVDETTKRQREFTPHITVQKSGRVQEGDAFTVDSLYIVEQKGGSKEIVSRIDL